MCLPAVFFGRPFLDIIKIYADQTDYGKQIQMNYPNVYAFMCNGQSVENYYLLKPLSIVLTMGILAAGLFLVLHKKVDLTKRGKLMMTGVWTSFTCLMFLSSMHERYSYLLDILLIAYFFMTLFANYEALTLGQTSIINIALYAYVTFIFVRETVLDKPALRFAHAEK